jgi:hypothetical protein
LFTILPRECVDCILEKIPDLKILFSYIFTKENLVESTSGILVKDVSPLLYSRTLDEIIIIDIDEKRVDHNMLSSIKVEPYDGSINYT